MNEGKFKVLQNKSKVCIFKYSAQLYQDKPTSVISWALTGHKLGLSSFLCAETDQSFLVRWNAKNGSILEKKVSKKYLRSELGNYQFEEEGFRWCAALNVVDDDRVPAIRPH